MLELSSEEDFETWLKDKPIGWAQVIAHRCALRVVPLLNLEKERSNPSDDLKSQFTLAILRASLISGIKSYSQYYKFSDAVSSREPSRAADAAIAIPKPGLIELEHIANRAILNSAASADATRAIVQIGDVALAAIALFATVDAAKIAANAINKTVDTADIACNHDVELLLLNQGATKNTQNLMALPLWHDQQNPLKTEWQSLKQFLSTFDLNGQFWIDWYQAKLDGTFHPGLTQVQQEKLYNKIATFPDELWEEGAEAVNQRIVELMEEIKKVEGNDHEVEIDEPLSLEIPPQNKNALQFKTNEEGIIELDTEANENELLNDQDAIDRHNEVDFLANELISSYDPNSSSANSAKPIVTKVQRYLEALGETPEEANVNFIIPRGEVLRQELEREENRDEFTSSPPLPDNFKSSLASLVGAHNIYVLLDPVLDKRDQARLGPDAKENLVSKEDGLKIVEDAFNEGLIEEEIVGAVSEDAETINEIPDPERRQDRRFSESIKNLSRLLLSNTQSIAKKIKENQKDILEAAVAGAGGGVLVTGGVIVVSSASWAVIGSIVGTGYTCFKGLQWIVKNEEWIIQRFDNKEEIKAFIEALKKLPLK